MCGLIIQREPEFQYIAKYEAMREALAHVLRIVDTHDFLDQELNNFQ